MATPKYTALATLTLSSTASSVTFGSIPAGYRDLVIVANGTASTGTQLVLRFNGSTSGYSEVAMLGYSGGTTSYTVSTTYISQMTFNTTRTNNLVQIMDYSATDKHKTVLIRADVGGSSTLADAARWANTSAINSISIGLEAGGATFSIGSTFDLFGVK